MTPAVEVEALVHAYKDRKALDGLSFAVEAGARYALLGPNGCGKTTLFRILSTLMPVQAGTVRLQGLDVTREPDAVRRKLGVVFQSPSLDMLLTIRENLACHGALYGLSGAELDARVQESLDALGLGDFDDDRVGILSGGFKRRVELAKVSMHKPEVILLDEPTVGLDPGMRREFWIWITDLQKARGVTVLYTTHLLDEAETADRVLIMDQGKRVAEGKPVELQAALGGEIVTLVGEDPEALATELKSAHGIDVQRVGDELRVSSPEARKQAADLLAKLGSRLVTLSVGRPTLEDVFVKHTGHTFWGGER